IEHRQRVIRAAELEGAHALQVLALEERLATGERVERAGGGDGRSMGDALEARRGRLDVGVGDAGRRAIVHSRSMWSSKVTSTSVPSRVRRTFTGRRSLPFNAPLASPRSTAPSI